eukprot:2096067-Amphidinium_carterae.1
MGQCRVYLCGLLATLGACKYKKQVMTQAATMGSAKQSAFLHPKDQNMMSTAVFKQLSIRL